VFFDWGLTCEYLKFKLEVFNLRRRIMMGKSRDTKKDAKKKPAKTIKEKRQEKQQKKHPK